MKQTKRTKQVSGLIRQKLGHIIATEINDPDLGIITVTRVDVSIDLKVARAFFSVVGGKKAMKKQINILKGLNKLLRQRLSQEIKLKYMPTLEMVFDQTTQKAQRIEDLLKKARENKNET